MLLNYTISCVDNFRYIKAAHQGDTLVAQAQTSHIGKNLAFLTVDITNKETGALVAQGRHTKFMAVKKKTETKADGIS